MPKEAGENVKVSECAQGSTNFEASENFSTFSFMLTQQRKWQCAMTNLLPILNPGVLHLSYHSARYFADTSDLLEKLSDIFTFVLYFVLGGGP